MLQLSDEAAVSLKMKGELLDKLPESRPAVRTIRFLMGIKDRRCASQVITNEERERFDQERLTALEPLKL